jgi:DNA-binding transcriptional MerR regulator
MDVPVQKKYSIKEVSETVGESESTLRYWEGEFKDIISPKRKEGGTRSYTEKDIEDVRMIQFLLRDRKLKLEGARKILKNNKKIAEKQTKLMNHLRHIHSELKALEKSFDR